MSINNCKSKDEDPMERMRILNESNLRYKTKLSESIERFQNMKKEQETKIKTLESENVFLKKLNKLYQNQIESLQAFKKFAFLVWDDLKSKKEKLTYQLNEIYM